MQRRSGAPQLWNQQRQLRFVHQRVQNLLCDVVEILNELGLINRPGNSCAWIFGVSSEQIV
ncbi:MAG: hypothetical protein C5B50_19235 [Verrucomicrobia bacterium]|nr:MAG: hypothetical protein C5B50_19235 [Verrucomicrobiota bacterium]